MIKKKEPSAFDFQVKLTGQTSAAFARAHPAVVHHLDVVPGAVGRVFVTRTHVECRVTRRRKGYASSHRAAVIYAGAAVRVECERDV